MIKATIQNTPYCTEITFPCTETELSEKLCEIGIDKDHLSPTGMVIDIEPAELSVLTDCEVSLDALNYLGKRMDGMDHLEQKQFLAVLSCDDLNINWGLKNIINLTYNLPRFTLIEDTDAPEKIGLTHMLNIRGVLSQAEVFLSIIKGKPSKKYSLRFLSWGILLSGVCLTQEVGFPKNENASTLSDIIEPIVPEKYFVSTKGAARICTRSSAERKGKEFTTAAELLAPSVRETEDRAYIRDFIPLT